MGKDLTRMDAVIVEVATRRGGHDPDGGEDTTLDMVIDYFGSEKWDLVLAVTPPDGPAFEHSGRFKIARRLGGLRAINKQWRPLPGLALPVLVSADRRKVEVDWDAFVAGGGIDQGEALTNERRSLQGAAEMGKMLAKNPKKAAKQRELALAHFPDQAIEVTTGVRPATEFSRSISSLVQGGALTEAEGNDFLRAAGLLQEGG